MRSDTVTKGPHDVITVSQMQYFILELALVQLDVLYYTISYCAAHIDVIKYLVVIAVILFLYHVSIK